MNQTSSQPTVPANRSREFSGKKFQFLIDLPRCIGCHACSVSCKTEHSVDLGGFRNRVRYLQKEGSLQLSFLPTMCMHCEDAPCLKVCPTEAISKLSDGTVSIDKSRCCGNKACVVACPYGAIYIEESTGKADKCDLCLHRTTLGLEPACVEACPTEALKFSNTNDDVTKESDRGLMEETNGSDCIPTVKYRGLKDWMETKIQSSVQLTDSETDIIYEQK